jgi:hypothetical protein
VPPKRKSLNEVKARQEGAGAEALKTEAMKFFVR